MEYKNVISGKFISRQNRFIAIVDVNGTEEIVHVKNTGRCKELLIEGRTVYLTISDNTDRKTKYDLIAVEKICDDGSVILINMDSQMPNYAVEEWIKHNNIFGVNATIKREVKYGNSRFDFYIESDNRKIFLEVKGVTLESNGIAMFPDAPTQRGVKHIKELIECIKWGFEAYIIFVVQMKGVNEFSPNYITHKEFGDVLRDADYNGINILAMDCKVTGNSIVIDSQIPIRF